MISKRVFFCLRYDSELMNIKSTNWNHDRSRRVGRHQQTMLRTEFLELLSRIYSQPLIVPGGGHPGLLTVTANRDDTLNHSSAWIHTPLSVFYFAAL